jgi:hypothetical protein
MTTEYYGMTPWEYNEWARSRENVSEGNANTGGGRSSNNTGGDRRGGGWSGDNQPTTDPNDPYKNIDQSPFKLGENDALALAAQQRVRDATDYRYNLAGLPQPIELWSGNVADTQRQLGLGLRPSLMPGTGAFADSDSLRAWQLAREAYMSDPIRAAQAAANPPPTSGGNTSGGNTGGWTGGSTSRGSTTSTPTSPKTGTTVNTKTGTTTTKTGTTTTKSGSTSTKSGSTWSK